MNTRKKPAPGRRKPMPKLERMYNHVLASALESGKPYPLAARIAAATVNKHRNSRMEKGGTKLVSRGGRRNQWYPGKGRAQGKKPVFVCLAHKKRFRSKAGMLAHFRGKAHKKGRK